MFVDVSDLRQALGALRRNGIRHGIGSGGPLGLRTLQLVLTQVVEVCVREESNVGFITVQVITCESKYSSGDAVEWLLE